LRSIKFDLSDKKHEAEQLLELISEMSALKGKVIKVAILKSAYVLLLYNTIESTMTVIFERIHEVLSSECYANLIPEIKMIWVNYFFKKHSEKKYQDYLDRTISGELKIPLLKEFLVRINLFSGNLDGRQLDKLLREYGIGKLNTVNRAKLLDIKNKRNKLAHGEEMFKESCRNMTIGELKVLYDATFESIDSIVSQVENYILNKKYLLAI
jgi:hypothetical protein